MGSGLIYICLQASNGRTVPRSSAVSPRSRAPRRTRTKRLAPHDSAWTDEWHGAMDATFGGLVVLESCLFRFLDRLWSVCMKSERMVSTALWMD